MRILVSGHGFEREPLDQARRTVPYDRLVLLSSDPTARDLATLRANDELSGATVIVHTAQTDDFAAALKLAHKAMQHEDKDILHVHVAGGPNAITSALLLAAFQNGVTAFFCHPRGISWLPVIHKTPFVDLFNEADRHVLLASSPSGTKTHTELVTKEFPIAAIRGALLRLKEKGLVEADATMTSPTETGRYYRAGLRKQP